MARCVARSDFRNKRGRHSVIKMDELGELVAALGFEDVWTPQASPETSLLIGKEEA